MHLKEAKFAFDNLTIRVLELVTGNIKIIIDNNTSVVIDRSRIDHLDEITGKKIVSIIKHLFIDAE
jgi:hypothetical protein